MFFSLTLHFTTSKDGQWTLLIFSVLCIGSAGSGCWLVAGARIIESDLTVLLNFLELTLLNFFVDPSPEFLARGTKLP